jgi:transposase-like protein
MAKKYSFDTKLAAVQYYLNGSDSIRVTTNKFNIAKTMLHRWVKRLELHGVKGLEEGTYTNYSIKFKMDVLNYMNEKEASSNHE